MVLILLCVLITAERAHTFNEPLDRDITTYAVIGSELLKGRSLYSDLWDHKPPGIHLAFAGMEAVAGESHAAVFLLGVITAIATMFGIYRAGVVLMGQRALWPAAFWALICSDLRLQANQPNCEAFLNAAMVWGFALMLPIDKLRTRRWVLIGLLFAGASLFKQAVVPIPLFLGLVHIAFSARDKARLRRACFQVLTMMSVIALAWVGTGLYFWVAGHFRAFYEAVILYNRAYAGNMLANLQRELSDLALFESNQIGFGPIAIGRITLLAGFCVGCLIMRRRPDRSLALLAAYLVGAEISVALPGHFAAHYYQLLMPPVVIGAGWVVSQAWRLPRLNIRFAPHLTATAVAILLVVQQAPAFQTPAQKWTILKHGTDDFVASESLGGRLSGILEPGETFYQWGAETGLYFASGKKPPSGVFYYYPLIQGPLMEKLADRTVKDLEREQPELVIITNRPPIVDSSPVLDWVRSKYRLIDIQPALPIFGLFARKGGRLEARLVARGRDAGPQPEGVR